MTATAERQEWLDARRVGLGGSDIGAILGVCQWRSAHDVWRTKVYGETAEDNDTLIRGRVVEGFLRETYAADRGVRVEMPGIVAGAEPWMLYTPDGLADDDGIWEGKTSIDRSGWSDEDSEATSRNAGRLVLPPYAFQAAWGLEVCDREWCDLTVAIVPFGADAIVRELLAAGVPDLPIGRAIVALSEVRHYRITRDREFGAALVGAARAWWERHVVAGEEPPITSTPGTEAWLLAQSPDALAPTRPATAGEAAMVEQWAAACDAKKRAERAADDLAAQIKAAIGEAGGLSLDPKRRVTWTWQERAAHMVRASRTRVLRRSWR